MRAWTKVWICIATICTIVTIYEIPSARLILRYINATMRRDRYTASGKLNIPVVVTDKLTTKDPEAGDMLRYCLKHSSEDANIEELAVLAAQYPENEFFLAQLTEELIRAGVVDPKAALAVVDKLQKLNVDNAHYRYLQGWILMANPDCPDYVQKAIEQFELGHRLPEFYLPYSKYKERLERLYAKATLFWERPRLRSLYMDLTRRLFLQSGLRGRLDESTFRDLSASAVKIGDRIIENAYDSETLLSGAVLLGPGEGFRLKDLDLSEAEAQQSRLRVARGLAILNIHGQLSYSDINTIISIVWMLWIPPVFFFTVLAILAVMMANFIKARFGRRKPKISKNFKIFLLIETALVLILVLLIMLALFKERSEGELPGSLLFVTVIFIMYDTLTLSGFHPAHLRRSHLYINALCGSLWFKGTVFWTAGSLSVFSTDSLTTWLQFGGILLAWSVFCALIWTEATYRPDSFTANHRYGIILLTYWVVALMVLHVTGSLCAQMNRLTADPLAPYRPFPQATQATYNRFILGREADQKVTQSYPYPGIPGRIEYSTAKDLKAFIAERKAAGEAIPNDSLLKLLRTCNRDLRSIFLDELEDPNDYDALIIRAEWGERSVKDQLERIFRERLDTFHKSEPEPPSHDPSSLGELLELAGTLARISDGPEGQDRLAYLLEYVVERTHSLGIGPNLTDPNHVERIMQPFWQSLGKLPKDYATKLVKSYLRQTRYVDLFGDRGRDLEQITALLADGDRELAEEIVGALAQSLIPSNVEESPDESNTESAYTHGIRLMRYRYHNSPPCLEAVFTHLSPESVPLLIEYLNSDNEQLRAFIVWCLTSLGYEWTNDRLRQLLNDPYWKVRLNTLFALGPDGLAEALNDENAVVRMIAQMLHQAQPS